MLQTQWFGQILNERVSNFAQKKAGIELQFDRVEVGVFPLATRLKNLKIRDKKVRVNAVSLGLEFGFRDILSNDFSIGNLVLENALVELDVGSSQDEESIKRSDLFNFYKTKILNQIPFKLRGVELKKSIIKLGKADLDAIDIKASLFQNIVSIKSTVGFSKNFFEFLGIERLAKASLDGLNGEIQLTRSYVRFKDFKLYSKNSFVEVDGKLGHDNTLQELKFTSFMDLKKLKKVLREDEVNPKILPTAGMAEIHGRLNGDLKEVTGSFKFNGSQLSSEVYRFGNLSAKLSLEKSIISLNEAYGTIGGGSLNLTSPSEVVDVKTVKFLYPDLFLDIKNIYTNQLLFFLPKLDKAKGYLTGPLKFSLRKKNLEMTTYEGFQISKFKLLGDNKDVLINPLIRFGPGSKINATYEGKVKTDVNLKFKGTDLELKGTVGDGRVDMAILPGEIDLLELGPVSGLQMYGQGAARGVISGPFDNVDFNFDLSPRNFKVLGFELGTISGNINFNTKASLLTLKNIKGNNLGLMYNMAGTIDFKNDDDALNMRVNIEKGNLDGAKTVIRPILKPMLPYFKNVQFNFESSLLMRGGLSVPKMDVKGKLNTSNVAIYSEDLETVSTDLFVKNNIVKFENIKGRKVTGTLTGRAQYNMNDKAYSYKGSLTNLRIKDLFYYRLLNLGLDGDAYGEFHGVGGE
ncbi:MAG: hypothetical protein NXH75_13595, partial [Halobacteriovoraceae bacterium]|nr:hypothetical protein [Halobacteriovoraceae bacterium]